MSNSQQAHDGSPRPRAPVYSDGYSDASYGFSYDPYRSIQQDPRPPPGPRYVESNPPRGYIPPPPPLGPQPRPTMNVPPPPPPRTHPPPMMNSPPPPPPFGQSWNTGGPQYAYLAPQPAQPYRAPRSYDPAAFTAVKTMLPGPSYARPRDPSEQPLTSATFVPGPGSFGPGVGIPPLHSPARYTRHSPTQQSSIYENQHQVFPPQTLQDSPVPVLPEIDQSRMRFSTDIDTAYSRETFRSSPTQTAQVPQAVVASGQSGGAYEAQPQGPQQTYNPSTAHLPSTPLGKNPTIVIPTGERRDVRESGPLAQMPFSFEDRHVTDAPPSPHGASWPLEKVLIWLSANHFPQTWQDAFKVLNMHGSHFLDIGRSKANVPILHSAIYPQVEKECAKAKIPYDHNATVAEGKRARKLIRGLVESGASGNSNLSTDSRHHRRSSFGIVSAGTDDGSPHFRDLTPDTANSGEESPISGQSQSQFDTSVPARPDRWRPAPKSGYEMTNSPLNSDVDPMSARSMVSRNTPGETSTANRKLSPGGVNRLRGNSLQDSSPRYDPAVVGQDERSSSNSDINLTPQDDRSSPDGSKSRGTNEPKSPALLHRVLRSKRNIADANSPTSPSEIYSPAGVDGHFGNKAVTRKPLPATERKLIFVTPDGWNYRLIDVTAFENLEAMKRKICDELVIPDNGRQNLTYHITFPGQTQLDEALTDALLLDARINSADPHASLKLYVHGLDSLGKPTLNGAAALSPFSAPSPASTVNEPPPVRGASPSTEAAENEANRAAAPPFAQRPRPPVSAYRSDGELKSRETVSLPPEKRKEILERRMEEYRRGKDRDLRAARAEKQKPLQQESSPADPSIRRATGRVIDFDERRQSPYDRTSSSFSDRSETQAPMRPAPPPPAEPSLTLRHISVRRPGSQNGGLARSATGSDKPVDEPGADESTIRPTEQQSGGLLQRRQSKKLENVHIGRIGLDTGARSGSPSPATPYTNSPGGQTFAIPDYAESGQAASEEGGRGTSSATERNQSDTTKRNSANVSPSTARAGFSFPNQPQKNDAAASDRSPFELPATNLLQRSVTVRSDNAEFNLPAEEVTFTSGYGPVIVEEDDSDEDLFQVPIRQSEAPSNASESTIIRGSRGSDQVSPTSTPTPGMSERQDPFGDNQKAQNKHLVTSDKADRRKSFHADHWANRPSHETLVEHLDTYFPGVNLDKKVILDNHGDSPEHEQSGSPDLSVPRINSSRSDKSSSQSGSPSLPPRNLQLPGAAPTSKPALPPRNRQQGFPSRQKSIREVVARNYSRSHAHSHSIASNSSFASDRTVSGPGVPPLPPRVQALKPEGGLHRRQSTKMFGAKIEQITSVGGFKMSPLETIPQDQPPASSKGGSNTSQLQRKPTFRWMRGITIGQGTFGTVYVALNTTTGDLFAVKEVEADPVKANLKLVRERFESLDREIETMQHLDNVNIVQYLGCERRQYSMAIFLEYISGGSIASVLRKHGKFEEPVIKSLTRQFLSGLAYLHGEGVLHRDLKGENILLDLDGTCRISDFGISKKSDNPYGNDATNRMEGSVFWMAPEVVSAQSKGNPNQGYSAKVDIWSAGCVIMEMYSGKRPWGKLEATTVMFKLLNGETPKVPEDVEPEMDPGGLSLLLDCLTTNPNDRPTAQKLLDEAPFCAFQPHYNFLDTSLYAKITGSMQ